MEETPSDSPPTSLFTFGLVSSGIEEAKGGSGGRGEEKAVSHLGPRVFKPKSSYSQEGFGFHRWFRARESHAADVVHASLVHHSHWKNAPRSFFAGKWLGVGGLPKTGKPLTDVTRPSGLL